MRTYILFEVTQQKNKLNQTKNDWEKKNLHAEIDIVKTNRWLKSAELKADAGEGQAV